MLHPLGMSTLELTLANKNLSPLVLRFKIKDTPIAQRWASMLAKKLDSPAPFDEPAAFFKAFKAAGRSEDDCWKDLIEAGKIIAAYDDRFLPKEFTELVLSQENLNLFHKSFENMRGEAIEGTEFYKKAPASVQAAIELLNEKIHETESLKGIPGNIGGLIKVNLKDKSREELSAEDYSQFSLDRNFGDVYLRYCMVGKSWVDVFNDRDQHVGEDNIRPLQHINGEFDISFREKNWHGSDEFKIPFYQWLRERGLSPEDPQLSLGWIVVAELEPVKMDRTNLCREIGLRTLQKAKIQPDI